LEDFYTTKVTFENQKNLDAIALALSTGQSHLKCAVRQ
jgi:hypothetical protein